MGAGQVGREATQIHARVDAKGRPVSMLISPGEEHDVTYAEALLEGLEPCAVVIADKAYDADRIRAQIRGARDRGPLCTGISSCDGSGWGCWEWHPELASRTVGSPPDTISLAPPSSLSSKLQPCEFGFDQLSPRPR
jgi:Transposase DDE domain